MKLLIVEDDVDTANFIQLVLEDEKHSVHTASNAATAQAQLADFEPDLIILDRQLPDKNGLEFCRELRGQPRFARVPVMFVSAARTTAEVAEGFNAGGDDYLTKPFEFDDLVARVQALLLRTKTPASGAPRPTP